MAENKKKMPNTKINKKRQKEIIKIIQKEKKKEIKSEW